jgi:hypothetical protein
MSPRPQDECPVAAVFSCGSPRQRGANASTLVCHFQSPLPVSMPADPLYATVAKIPQLFPPNIIQLPRFLLFSHLAKTALIITPW